MAAAQILKRPECFEFAMDFLGDPEEPEVRAYVEGLEADLQEALDFLIFHTQDEGPAGEGWKSDKLMALVARIEQRLKP